MLLVMVFVQIGMNIGFTMLSPIMPLFLPRIGVTDPRLVDLWSGALGFITPMLAALAAPIWGRVADRRGRKLMVLRSCVAIGAFIGLMSLAQNIWQLFGLRSLMGVFAGFNSATIALVATQAPARRLGYALGWISTGQLVGALVGPLAGGAIADLTGSYRAPFAVTAVICLLCGAGVLAGIKEGFVPPKAGSARTPFSQGFVILWRTPGLVPLFVVLLLAQLGVQAVQPVVTIFVTELTGPRADIATLAGMAFSVTGVADLIASPFLGRRSDVIGYRRVLLISLAGAALATAPQFLVTGYWGFVAARFGLGLFVGGILPTANALVGRLAPPEHKGAVYGATSSAMFLGGSFGPLTGGTIAALVGVRWVFVVVAVLLTVNLIWVWRKVPDIK
jgi:DHA1 family multidrug resistance protein-like MFS transporter